MSYLVLARKYRPQTFDQVVKQDHVTRTLSNAISSGRVPHAILFSGPRGTGKTTVARILAKAMNCEGGPRPVPCNTCRSCREITSGNAADVFEIDGASNNSVDQVRELRENTKYIPAHSPYKIYIIDEVHMLSTAAFNALLKTLEEPPSHILFFFATTEPNKIPITILSRCQRHDLKRIDLESISKHMKSLCSVEKVDISDESLSLIAGESGGGMRDALSLLDQVMSCSEGMITHAHILNILGVIDRKIIFAISAAILRKNVLDILDIIDEIFDRGHDIKKFYSDIAEHFRNLLVIKLGKKIDKLVKVPAHEKAMMAGQVENISELYLSQILDILFKEEAAIKRSSQPKISLEILFIKIFQITPALSIDVLIQKLDALRDEFASSPAEIGKKPAGVNFQRENNRPPEKISEPASDYSPAPPAPETPDIVNVPGSQACPTENSWPNFVSRLSSNHPSLAACLNTSRLIRLTENTLELEVNGSSFNINMVKRNKNMEILKAACRDFYGEKLAIEIKTKMSTDNNDKKKTDRAGKLRQEALNHPLVQDAIEVFNGRIVDVKIL